MLLFSSKFLIFSLSALLLILDTVDGMKETIESEESSSDPDSEIIMPNNIDKSGNTNDSLNTGDKNIEIEELESSESTITSHEIESHGEEVNENGIEPAEEIEKNKGKGKLKLKIELELKKVKEMKKPFIGNKSLSESGANNNSIPQRNKSNALKKIGAFLPKKFHKKAPKSPPNSKSSPPHPLPSLLQIPCMTKKGHNTVNLKLNLHKLDSDVVKKSENKLKKSLKSKMLCCLGGKEKEFHILENGEYSLDGKVTIKEHIELTYLNENYNAEKAAESLKICDKIEIENKKYWQKIAQRTKKQKMELEKIKAALKNAQNYCANEFKQKHIEKIFLFMHRIGIILLKYRIAKMHHHSNILLELNAERDKQFNGLTKEEKKLKMKKERDNEKTYCVNFVNKLKEDETLAEKAMKLLFEQAKKNCSPEMTKLREQMDPFCKGGNGDQSQLGKWIEANFVENNGKHDEEMGIDVRHKLHQRLANYCAFIEMSSLDIGIFWCKKHKIYKTSKGESVLEKQNEKQKTEYKKEMENICERIQKLRENEQSAGELLKKISLYPLNEGSVVTPEYSAAKEFLEKISLNFENSILKDLLGISPEQADQMKEITTNCDHFEQENEEDHQSEILPEGKENENSPTHPSTSSTSNKHVHSKSAAEIKTKDNKSNHFRNHSF